MEAGELTQTSVIFSRYYQGLLTDHASEEESPTWRWRSFSPTLSETLELSGITQTSKSKARWLTFQILK
jgi:hypothetical protein